MIEEYIIKGKLSDKEQEVQLLRQRDLVNTDAIVELIRPVKQGHAGY